MRNKSGFFVAAVLVLASIGAQARDVYWSVGINAPVQPGVSIGTVISNGPAYRPAPMYYETAPVYYSAAPVIYAEPIYYRPAPVFVRPAPVVYLPQPYYAPRRVVYAQGWAPSYRGHGHGHGHGRDKWRDDDRSRGEPVMSRRNER